MSSHPLDATEDETRLQGIFCSVNSFAVRRTLAGSCVRRASVGLAYNPERHARRSGVAFSVSCETHFWMRSVTS